ncbi:hypothetical protein Tco_0386603 [Tanacetum coccineum]
MDVAFHSPLHIWLLHQLPKNVLDPLASKGKTSDIAPKGKSIDMAESNIEGPEWPTNVDIPDAKFIEGIDVVDLNGCDIFYAPKLPFGVSERSENFCIATPRKDIKDKKKQKQSKTDKEMEKTSQEQRNSQRSKPDQPIQQERKPSEVPRSKSDKCAKFQRPIWSFEVQGLNLPNVESCFVKRKKKKERTRAESDNVKLVL